MSMCGADGVETPGGILIVDDDLDSLQLLRRQLEDAGYFVRLANSGELALLSAFRQAPDLVLLDVDMPGMDGFDVCRCLKRHPAMASVPVVFISASADSDDRMEGFDAGGADYVGKPFDATEVLARVAVHIRISLQAKELLRRYALAGTAAATAPQTEIMVVEDTPESMRLLTAILERGGYAVRQAPNGELALWSAARKPPALLLLDVRMPGMNGFDVCRCLKADPATAEIPVIFITALGDVEDKREGFTVGGADFIVKPFANDEVLARVAVHLGGRGPADETSSVAASPSWTGVGALRRAFDTSGSAALICDHAGHVLHANPAWIGMTGISPGAGTELRTLVTPQATDAADFWAAFDECGYWHGDVSLPPGGGNLACRMSLSRLGVVGSKSPTCLAMFRHRLPGESDGTLELYDPRTGLPNRTHARREFANMAQAAHERKPRLLLMLIEFAATAPGGIESAMHRACARRCEWLDATACLYREDACHLALLLPLAAGDDDLAAHGMELLRRLDAELDPSVGGAVRRIGLISPARGDDTLDSLLAALRQCMCWADPGQRICMPTDDDSAMPDGELLAAGIRRALDCGELDIRYRPVDRTAARQPVAVDAAPVWLCPGVGEISAPKFMPVAEETGASVAILHWTLRTACGQIGRWRRQGADVQRLIVGVPVLPFWQDSLAAAVAEALGDSGLPAQVLALRLDAAVRRDDPEQADAVVTEINGLGVAVTDEVGKGKGLPADAFAIRWLFPDAAAE